MPPPKLDRARNGAVVRAGGGRVHCSADGLPRGRSDRDVQVSVVRRTRGPSPGAIRIDASAALTSTESPIDEGDELLNDVNEGVVGDLLAETVVRNRGADRIADTPLACTSRGD